jgi:hypothetical protein
VTFFLTDATDSKRIGSYLGPLASLFRTKACHETWNLDAWRTPAKQKVVFVLMGARASSATSHLHVFISATLKQKLLMD